MQAKRESLSMNSALPANNNRLCETNVDAGITGDSGDTGNASNAGVAPDSNQNERSVQRESDTSAALTLSPPKRNKRPKKVNEQSSGSDAYNQRLRDECNEQPATCEPQKQLSTANTTNDTSIEIRAGDDRKASPTSVQSSPTPRVKFASRSKLLQRTLNSVIPYSRRFMDRMQALSHEYITSEEAKTKRIRRCEQFRQYLKSFFTHLFSTAGLCALTVGYSLLGAALFLECESETSKHATEEAIELRLRLKNQLWNVTEVHNVLNEKLWKADAAQYIDVYEKKLLKLVQDKGYKGADVNDWSFPSALLYAITVITTIGYGNLTPHTWMGRLATMLYAVIGIPIMLLCLTNLGNIMAKTFRFSYKKICCCFCCSRSDVNRNACKTQTLRTQVIELEDRRNNEINANNTGTNNVMIGCKESPDDSDANSILKQPSPQPSPMTQQRSPVHSLEQQSMVVIETYADELNAERVPVWLVGLLVFGYIWGGGWMFSVFEEWDSSFIGAYFCFISLSTIGFGDYVPSKTVNPTVAKHGTDGQLILIAVCFYLVFGLSLIAMSFNLVQEEILLKVRIIARRVGIVPHDR